MSGASLRGVGRSRVLFLAGGLLFACGDGVRTDQLAGSLNVPELVDFGEVQVGLETTRPITVENLGSAAVEITAVEVPDSFQTARYEFAVPREPFRITAGGSHVLELSFVGLSVAELPVETQLSLVTDIKTESGAMLRYSVLVRAKTIHSGLVVEPQPVDFGTVLVGSSKTLTVRLTNGLDVPTPVRTRVDGAGRPDIAVTGANGLFEVLSDVARDGSLVGPDAMLAPGASVEVQLRYSPRLGLDGVEDRGRWVVSNCDGLACERTVILTGRGTNAAIACAPATLEFGDVNEGSTVSRRLSCRNQAQEPVTVSGWEVSLDSDPGFSVDPYAGQPASLGPAQSFDVDIRFRPNLEGGGLRTGTFVLRGRNPRANVDLTPVSVRLEGSAGGPDLRLSPSHLSFGRIAVGTTSRLRFLVENVGRKELIVSAVSLSGAAAFRLEGQPFVVQSGQARAVEVDYAPLAVGEHQATVTVLSNDPEEPSVELTLSGRAEDLPPCSYLVTPESITFGMVEILRHSTQGVRIQNLGQSDCLLNNLQVALGSDPAFSLAQGAANEVILPPGQSLTTVVEYLPATEGRHEGLFSFYISDPARSHRDIPLSGVGAQGALLISPDEIDFGRVGVSCASRERNITVFNTGAVPTTVSGVSLPAGVSNEFTLTRLPAGLSSQQGVSLAPGQSLEFGVGYRALDEGHDNGTIRLVEQGQSDPYFIPLYGEGALEPINEEHFTQLERPEVDILFVIDNSCSMSDEQANLSANFSSFIAFADNLELDYQIGVVTTDVEGGFPGPRCPSPLVGARPSGLAQGACGYFADGNADGSQRDPTWRIIERRTLPSPGAAFAATVIQGTHGSGNEQGLQAAYNALSAPIITDWNRGFVRPDAHLAVVFVADEDDHSTHSVPFYVNSFRAIKGFRNPQLFSASAIVGDPAVGCGLQAESGTRYIQVAQETGGVFESICTENWSAALENLGRSVFGYKSRFLLANQPEPGSIEVLVDGFPVAATAPSGQTRWTYDQTAQSVDFAPLAIPEPGSQIVIRYRAECL